MFNQAIVDLSFSITHPQGDTQWNSLRETLNNDALHRLERQVKFEGERCILMAAKLISPVIEDSFTVGYQWYVYNIEKRHPVSMEFQRCKRNIYVSGV